MALFSFLFVLNPILIIAAAVPAIFLMIKVYQADRLEHEPISLLVSIVFIAIGSCLIAMLFETIGGAILGIFFAEDSLVYNILMYFGVVGFSEEWGKYILMKKRTWNSPEFNCQFDGIVYAVTAALGFALWENIEYVLMYGLGTALIRAFTAVPGHASFGVFMGLFYGMARAAAYQGDEDRSKVYRRLAVLVPMFIHGFYDFVASSGSTIGIIVFVVFIIVLFVVAFKEVKKMSASDHYIDGGYVSGGYDDPGDDIY